MSRELRHKNAAGFPLNGKTQLQWVENWDVKVLWRHHSCCWDQRRRRNKWFQQQEILKSCALTCWCLMRYEFFHTSIFEDSWGLSGCSEVSERVVSTLMPFLQGTCQWVCHSYLATYEHKVYGNLTPSRPRSLCQNWLKLANGLQSYFLWDWEGTDGLALKGT